MKIKSILLTIVISLFFITVFSQTNEEKYKNAKNMIDNFQFAEAIDVLTELTTAEPDNYLYFKDLAYSYLSSFQYETSIKYYEKSVELNPDCIKCYSHLARAWFELGNLDQAKGIIDETFKLSDTTAHLYMTRGLIYQGKGDSDNAMLDFTRAIQLDKENIDFLITRANFYIQTNQSHFAYSDLSKAIELNPEEAEYYYYRAYILLNLNLLDEALIDIKEAVRIDTTVSDYYNLQFSIYFSRLEYDLAEQSILKSLELNPNSYMAYINLGDLYFQTSKMDKYCESNQKAISLIPEEYFDQTEEIRITTDKYCNEDRMPYYFVRGLSLYNKKDYQETIDLLNKGLEKLDKSSVLENLIGSSYIALQNYDEAEKFFLKSYENKDMLKSEVIDFYSIELSEEDIAFVAKSYVVKSDFGLSMIHLRNHQPEDAMQRADVASEMAESMEGFDGKEFVYNVKGLIYIYKNDIDNAVKQFEIGIGKNPYYQQSYLNLAIVKILKACKYKSSSIDFIFSDYFNSMRMVIPKLKLNANNESLLQEALKICNTAIKYDSKNAYAYLIKAKILELQQDPEYKSFADEAVEAGITNAYEELNIKK
jgi:tetratricopeptide (TPR) repeat protein